MKIQFDVDPQHAEDFWRALGKIRNVAANELLTLVQERDVSRATGAVVVLGQISKAFYEGLAKERPQVIRDVRAEA